MANLFAVRGAVTLLGLAALAGCSGGDDDTEPNQALIGKWALDLPSSPGDACGLAGVFWETKYEIDLICRLSDGSLGVEAEVGDYQADGKTLSTTPTHASCKQADRNHGPDSIAYGVSGSTLRIVTPSGAILLQKLTDDPNAVGTGTAVIHFGCANDDAFVYAPVEAL